MVNKIPYNHIKTKFTLGVKYQQSLVGKTTIKLITQVKSL